MFGWFQLGVLQQARNLTAHIQNIAAFALGAPNRCYEPSKNVNGKGHWMFFGNASATQSGVDRWWLLELNAFRAALIRQGNGGHQIAMGDQTNPDGTMFKWFDVRSFPAEPPLVVASQQYSR